MRTVLSSTPALAALLVSLSVSAIGCGQLEGDPGEAPIIATIRGQLANPDGYAAGANMRVAIVWGGETGGGLRVSQDVPVQPVFPSQFKLDVRSLPPASAMRAPGSDRPNVTECSEGWDPSSGKPQPPASSLCDNTPPNVGPPGPTPAPPPVPSGTRIQSDDELRVAKPGDPFKIAIGSLIAYEDLNGNGQLDLLDDSATNAVDRVVGVNEELYVVYVEGSPTGDFAQLSLPKGFSQVALPKCVSGRDTAEDTMGRDRGGVVPTAEEEPVAGEKEPVAGQPVPMPTVMCSGDPTVRAIETLFTLPLTAAPRFSEFMCRGEGGTIHVSGVAPPPVTQVGGGANGPEAYYPAASDPKLRCKADGTGYTYAPCESSQNLCGDRVACSTMSVSRPSPAPANWPCAAQ